MRLRIGSAAWWGPPKKFDRPIGERRISWLELFYDLVYVIAIARITHHLSQHISFSGFLEYACLFILIFWGWLNGSLYHDLHGNSGLRTRLMTLWQVMIIAALAVTISESPGRSYANTTIVFMIMQCFITYQWWSVGFYDKAHRRYNEPYTILFLLALALMGLSLFVSQAWLEWIVPVVIICNYTPPFIAHRLMRRSSMNIDLSSSMAERLGLFTIIVFGEVVLGVVNGVSKMDDLSFSAWLNFALAVSIVFALWWILFTLASRREAKKGFFNATLLELLFIPALISLGLIAACLNGLFETGSGVHSLHTVFGYAITTFLACISLLMGLLDFATEMQPIKRPIRISLAITAAVFIGWTLTGLHLNTLYYLLLVMGILVVEIIYLNSLYYSLNITSPVPTE
jgi:low temperature requirement protein LtrA